MLTGGTGRKTDFRSLGCLGGVVLAFIALVLEWYRLPLFWITAVVFATAVSVVLFWSMQRAARRRKRQLFTWQECVTEINALPVEEAKRRLEELLPDAAIFSLTPVMVQPRGTDLSPAVHDLFSRYSTITVGNLSIGAILPPMPWGQRAEEHFAIKPPYLLIGYDQHNNENGEPLVAQRGDDRLYLLHNFEDSTTDAEEVAPTAYHLLLARALCVKQERHMVS